MTSILFVCTANRYRSPIAEACFKKELIEHEMGMDWNVLSAGTWTKDGLPPVQEAILKAEELGLDIQIHRSQVVTEHLVQRSDLVLVMERGQKEALQVEFRSHRQRIALLTEIVEGTTQDISDPMIDPHNSDAGQIICSFIHAGFEKICARTLENSKRS
jgi:protein-tyrosine phosphatase